MQQLTGGVQIPRTVIKPMRKEIRIDAIVSEALATSEY